MIVGTSYSPSKALIDFSYHFFEALSEGDYAAAIGKLDLREGKWSKDLLELELSKVIEKNRICSPSGIMKSASPELIQDNNVYELTHRIPISGKWSKHSVIFKFVQKPNSGYFYVSIKAIQP